MNKFTYAAFSTVMGLLFFIIVSLNFITKVLTGIVTLSFLFATMIKMIIVVCFKEMSGYARAEVSYNEQGLSYA